VKIVVASIGRLDDGTMAAALRYLRGSQRGEVRLAAPIDVPDGAFDARRGQFSSVAFMLALQRAIPPDADRILGLTACDLFIPMLTFVFGQAQLRGRVALVSLARLQQQFYSAPPDPELLRLRLEKEIGHELGHTFGLIHCPDRACVMSLATSIQEVDSKTAGFCNTCRRAAADGGMKLETEEHESKMADPGSR
jgi:archaemetzincin